MPKMDKNGREYIEQDGKRYYRNFWGEWEAEKDIFGNNKVDTDIFGNPKIETDIFGNQKIETDWLGNPYVEPEKKDDSGCYLTTACLRAKGTNFNDDCAELTILRRFRDSYVKVFHPEDIKTYYRTAPQIVEAIGSMPNSTSIYESMYSELVLGTIDLIKKSQLENAYNFYKDYEKNLMRVYQVEDA